MSEDLKQKIENLKINQCTECGGDRPNIRPVGKHRCQWQAFCTGDLERTCPKQTGWYDNILDAVEAWNKANPSDA